MYILALYFLLFFKMLKKCNGQTKVFIKTVKVHVLEEKHVYSHFLH